MLTIFIKTNCEPSDSDEGFMTRMKTMHIRPDAARHSKLAKEHAKPISSQMDNPSFQYELAMAKAHTASHF